MRLLPRLLLLLLVFPATLLLRGGPGGSLVTAQDLTEDEETVEDSVIEDEDDEAEVEEDEPTDLSCDRLSEEAALSAQWSASGPSRVVRSRGAGGERGLLGPWGRGALLSARDWTRPPVHRAAETHVPHWLPTPRDIPAPVQGRTETVLCPERRSRYVSTMLCFSLLVTNPFLPFSQAEDKEEEDVSGEPEASPSADTTILFVKGEDFPANNIVKFLVGFTNKGTEDFIVESLDASFRYPQDYQFYIQNFTALPLNTVVPPQRQATFEYSFIPAEPMGGRPFGLVINLNYKDLNGNVFQDAVFNQTVTIIEREDGLDGETIFMYMFLAGLGLLVVIGLHQLLESRKRKRPIQKVEMGTSSQNDVDMSWIPQETLNQISKCTAGRWFSEWDSSA
ncbi:Translocon-associated protein subunit alpha [Galemys pyrenaicus]|uniref:Translocon-associated protein subunit alpha n=1 Tax=Galemys pyrenaicus TaxID=202257 RepID=A0A8J6A6E5_GALPY|nr:Translocon-associated protein subunit alpha [Galemys pyrenaicus]